MDIINEKELIALRELEFTLGIEIEIFRNKERYNRSLSAQTSVKKIVQQRKYIYETKQKPIAECEIDNSGKVISLRLSNLQISKLPGAIRDLTSLKTLNLSGNELRSMPTWTKGLVKLRSLKLDNNKFSKIPAGVNSLNKLVLLDLSYNLFDKIPREISNISHFRRLYLLGNDIKKISKTMFQYNFNILGGANYLNEILVVDRCVWIDDNPIESPPLEIIKEGRESVFAYFASIEEETLPLNETKVILVGDGGAGKTCLVKRMLGQGFNRYESQTHGINIENWKVECERGETSLNVWDFGGQEIMHATHQFFLSQRSLYVLVLDGRKEEDPEYWLKHVQSFGGNSPVLIVLNKIDENPGFDVNRRFLRRKYPRIQSFHRTSCKSGEGIDEVSQAINKSVDEVEITRTDWPKPWFEIKTSLQDLGDNFITYNEFADICEKHGVDREKVQQTLVTFLHDLGVVVHFSDFRLKDTHVLEPRWLTGAVYRIINAEILADNHGVINMQDISILLSLRDGEFYYPLHTHAFIVDIMKKFELCYSIDDYTILVPDLLEVQEPDIDFNYDKSLAFRIDYDFLPRSIMPRFIVRQHAAIHEGLCWRTGVVLWDSTLGSAAVVKSDQAAKRIYINVIGKHVRDYLTVIRTTLDEINRSFEKLEYKERIPMPDDPEVAVAYNHLLLLEERGELEYFPDGASRAYNVQELLGTVRIENKYTEQEFLRILQSVVNRTDSEEKIIEKANDIVMMQPNFMGMGIDLNAATKKLIQRFKRSKIKK